MSGKDEQASSLEGHWVLPQVQAPESGAPPPRGGHVSVAVGTKVVVFGGANRAAAPFTDLWVLETEGGQYQWTLINPVLGPGVNLSPRSGATMTAIGHEVYLYGGQDPVTGICFDDILILDTKTWRWLAVEVESGKPPARHSHCTGLFKGICLLVFGGAGMHGTLGDIWIFNTGDRTWITPVAEGKPPCPREMHTGTMITDGRMLVFGGRSPAGQVLCDFSVFDGDTGMWIESVPTPHFLCCHSAVALLPAAPTPPSASPSPLEGTSSSTLDQALHATNGALPNGAAHSSGRPDHPFAFTPAQPQQQALCLLYGGFTGGGVEGTLLAVDQATCAIEMLERAPRDVSEMGSKPLVRFAHSAVAVPTNFGGKPSTEMIIFGGVSPDTDFNDIAVWRPGRQPTRISTHG